MQQNLNLLITTDLEYCCVILILILNLSLMMIQFIKLGSILHFTLKIKDKTLLYINILLLFLTLLRSETFLYAVIGSGFGRMNPLFFRALSQVCYLFYDLSLGLVASTWIAILCKFFILKKHHQKIKLILNTLIIGLFLMCLFSLIISVHYNKNNNNLHLWTIFSSLFFVDCIFILTIFVFGCYSFLNHLKKVHSITNRYKNTLKIQIIVLLIGQLFRLFYVQMKIWFYDWLLSIKYKNQEVDEDSTIWIIFYFLLFFVGDYIPTCVLVRIFFPHQTTHRQSSILEDINYQ